MDAWVKPAHDESVVVRTTQRLRERVLIVPTFGLFAVRVSAVALGFVDERWATAQGSEGHSASGYRIF
jgi:hypothetical protein